MIKKNHLLHVVVAAVSACCITTATNAQAFEKGTSVLNLGVGLGGYSYNYLSAYSNVSSTPTLSASYELGIAELGPDVLGIGVMFGYNRRSINETSTSWTTVYNYDESWTNMLFGVRAMYHFNWFHDIEKLDLYAGVLTGYNVGSHKDESTYTVNGVTRPYYASSSSSLGSFRSGVFAGARWYFSNNFGVFGELGYSVASINVGASLKF